ncbi:AraC family transcriptional regulator, partial [Vibrio anguillarum]|nr:AraC family transcriptional regulator [Vibrio anguillarum]
MQANNLIRDFPDKQFITKTTIMASGYIDDFHSH